MAGNPNFYNNKNYFLLYLKGKEMATITSRAEIFANYIITNRETIRNTAAHFNISKSTVHFDVSHKLQKINKKLYLEVKKILDQNFNEKHIRGGYATKQKYEKFANEQNKKRKQ